jgi:hypothetical protein
MNYDFLRLVEYHKICPTRENHYGDGGDFSCVIYRFITAVGGILHQT